ncbi:MAG: helix-turn-helix domain-containing protein, partial [Candidatus Paceibacterota bacterium]
QLAQKFQGDNMLNAAPTDPDEVAKFCKVCDNCQDYFDKVKNNESVVIEKVDVGKDAKILIDLVRTLSTNYGFTNLIGILTGSKAKTFPDRLKQCTYYGRGDHRSQVFWKALGDILITEGYLKYSKIGGLYGTSNRKSKKKFDNSQVMQVVTMGPKRMEGTTLLLIPPPDLYKFYKTAETEKKSKSVDESNKTGQLMQELKDFRSEISVQMNLPPYILLADTVINALLQVKLPTDISKLALVDGFNTQVLMLYGDDLVGLMNRIHNSHGGGNDEIDEIIEKKSSSIKSSGGSGAGAGSGGTVTKPSYILGATVLETKKLFDLGLSVKDIATRRNMSTSTIEGHIATIFATFENMDYSKFLEEDMKVQIEEFLVSNPNMKLSEIKEGLTEFNINASYLQIKLVMAINHQLLN